MERHLVGEEITEMVPVGGQELRQLRARALVDQPAIGVECLARTGHEQTAPGPEPAAQRAQHRHRLVPQVRLHGALAAWQHC